VTGEGSMAGRNLTDAAGHTGAASLRRPQSLNRYAYVENQPLSLIDPSGLDGCDGISVGSDGGSACGSGSDEEYGTDPDPDPIDMSDIIISMRGVGYAYNDPQVAPNLFFQVYCSLTPGDPACVQSRLPGEFCTLGLCAFSSTSAGGGHSAECVAKALYAAGGAAIGIKPQGADPAGETADQIKEAAHNPVVRATIGAVAARVSVRLGAFLADELVPVAGQLAGVYIVGSAIKDGIEGYDDSIEGCPE
jgi:hypothetical protein